MHSVFQPLCMLSNLDIINKTKFDIKSSISSISNHMKALLRVIIEIFHKLDKIIGAKCLPEKVYVYFYMSLLQNFYRTFNLSFL